MRLPKDRWIALCKSLGYEPHEVHKIEFYEDGAVEIMTMTQYHQMQTYQ